MLRHVDGFRRFIDESEKRRAEFAEQKNLFSEYLPYAIVFGATKKWAHAFEGLDGEPPDTSTWYPHSGVFNALVFSSAIDGFTVTTAGTLTSVPASTSGSSGFSGGGFSGGGAVAEAAEGPGERTAVGSCGMGPLIVELAGIGPGPFCGMLLSDMGAEVVRVERLQAVTGEQRAINYAVVGRGRRSIGVDLKHPDGVECVLRLVERPTR